MQVCEKNSLKFILKQLTGVFKFISLHIVIEMALRLVIPHHTVAMSAEQHSSKQVLMDPTGYCKH